MGGVNPSSPGFAISFGSYAGNSASNRAVPHGLGHKPSLVLIVQEGAQPTFVIMEDAVISDINIASYAVTAKDVTNFYVGNVGNYGQSANGAANYHWIAVG
jgi:hypothetical protein